MEKIQKNINKVLLYTILILICLKTTQLYNLLFLDKLLPILVCFSFVLIILNYKKFNKEYFRDNYLIVIYCVMRIISISINKGAILNLKTFIYEIFFLIIVSQLFEKENIKNISKPVILLNFTFNVASIIYQYILKMQFDIELCGVYTNPNAVANYTCLSIILYKEFLENKDTKKNKILNWCYILFSLVIILLSKSRTPYICLIIYILIKFILNKGIDLKKIKRLFSIFLIGSLMCIITISYLNRANNIPTEFEKSINDLTTNRYYLWKYSIFSLERNPILGIGENNIGEYRRAYVNEETMRSINSEAREEGITKNNDHNGYIQLLVGNGYICFIIFMIILFKKIKIMDEKIFLVSSVILVINLFENDLILTQSIFTFILMYLLNYKEEQKNIR